MQLLALLIKVRIPTAFLSLKNLSNPLRERLFSFRDLRGMNIVFPRDLLDRFLPFECFQRHSRLPCCFVSSSFRFHFFIP